MQEQERDLVHLPEPGSTEALKAAGRMVEILAGDATPEQLAQGLQELTEGELDLTPEEIIAILNGDFSSLDVFPNDQEPPQFTTEPD
mgnify:CR=1 FL=1